MTIFYADLFRISDSSPYDFAEILKFWILEKNNLWNRASRLFLLYTYLPNVPAYMWTKKSVKRITNSMVIIIAGVLLKDFTTVQGLYHD
jgi:hypothetical protein